MKDICHSESRIPKHYHQKLRKVKDLGMDVYMVYDKHDEGLFAYKFCGYERQLPKNFNQRGYREVSCARMHYPVSYTHLTLPTKRIV